MDKPKIKVIPANPFLAWERAEGIKNGGIGIYCSVTTLEPAQLRSLSEQISGLIHSLKERKINLQNLEEVYIDIQPGLRRNHPEFDRMIGDVKVGRIKTIIMKSIRQLSEDAEALIKVIETVQNENGHIIFDADNLDTDKPYDDPELFFQVKRAQEKIRDQSGSINWGIRRKLQNGKSKLYNKPCYGYKKNKNGSLIVDRNTSWVVRKIYTIYLEGKSLIGIKRELEQRKIPSPTGKEKWSVKTIENILKNEKYCGNVTVLKSKTETGTSKRVKPADGDVQYMISNHHPAIITVQDFNEVQDEFFRRSSIEIGPDGKKKRKTTRYSSKKV